MNYTKSYEIISIFMYMIPFNIFKYNLYIYAAMMIHKSSKNFIPNTTLMKKELRGVKDIRGLQIHI